MNTELLENDVVNYFNATDVLKKYNSKSTKKKVIAEFLSNASTTTLIKNIESNSPFEPVIAKRGSGGKTLMHPKMYTYFVNWLYKLPAQYYEREENHFSKSIIEAFQNLYEFSAQVRIGNYIVDLCCDKHKIVIEFDEKYHSLKTSVQKDKKRDRKLMSLGYRVIRHNQGESIFKTINKVLTLPSLI